ncbi:hypothetical protein [Paraburkholderia hospita]|uniref:hypothetical protein n=1 Tax=Paraburkholderia hospita TaxID=169430 RepID=UPI001ABEB464|nr:hypothetical protein [Paraburkholderia hospita]
MISSFWSSVFFKGMCSREATDAQSGKTLNYARAYECHRTPCTPPMDTSTPTRRLIQLATQYLLQARDEKHGVNSLPWSHV